MSVSDTAPYEVKSSETGDYYIVLSAANLTFQRGLSQHEANRIVDIMNGRAKENLAAAEKIRAGVL